MKIMHAKQILCNFIFDMVSKVKKLYDYIYFISCFSLLNCSAKIICRLNFLLEKNFLYPICLFSLALVVFVATHHRSLKEGLIFLFFV